MSPPGTDAEATDRPSPTSVPWSWVAGGLAYSAFAMLFPPFTLQQYVVTGIPCVVVVGLAVRRGWLRPGWVAPPARVPGPTSIAVLWVVLLGLVTAVQLFHFFDWPRDVYPTLSSLASRVFDIYPVRVAAFAAWAWFGWYLVDR